MSTLRGAIRALKGSIIGKIRWILKKYLLKDVMDQIGEQKILLAQLNIDRIKTINATSSLSEVEFKVFSQNGEDGVIQYLINKIPIKNDVFIEFGIQDYSESNTRFLLVNNRWSGLVIDCDKAAIARLEKDPIVARYDINTVCTFITKDNINQIIEGEGIGGEIGLLSIDVDGNDYWVWKAIDVVSPVIVICEYNSIFGPDCPVTIPYEPSFKGLGAHYSHSYFGASLPALCRLAEAKGYDFVGSDSSGTNAFFVRKDSIGSLKPLTAKEGYVKIKRRRAQDQSGRPLNISGENSLKLIGDLPVYDVDAMKVYPIKRLWKV